ncbi:PstS family phosphate ABC transporter substrate-binding protein [Chondromyces apiculatus]|uniref:Phosphate-binding protein n=1 Tax=Chondromyces apiculatus DSM 436 TaxID=1192034 RepID=A0A017T8X4_9BACT|nr:PstS family phosphate ABC transporter substrate-binding protein [Chondromyces apiculatus]EYF05412.1 Phosphate ABC transporter, periplasmic phosphate-binding protein PstS [Chondromyces apiculatus DSM 436]
MRGLTPPAALVAQVAAGTLACALAGCGRPGGGAVVTADGSSTLYPLSEAVAEDLQRAHPTTRVTVGISGTDGGLQKLCAGDVDICAASRTIRPTEAQACDRAGITYVELPVAFDGIALVANRKNTWADHLTTAELRRIWEPAAEGRVSRWSDVRPGWPERPLRLFGAGVDSGTYDHFTHAIVGRMHASRSDYTSSEDDNLLVTGVTGDELALGFVGYAYHEQNRDRLKLIPIDDGDPSNGAGAISPTPDTITRGTYQPLSRLLFLYVSRRSLARPEVDSFVTFYLQHAADLAREVGLIPLPESAYTRARARVTSPTE